MECTSKVTPLPGMPRSRAQAPRSNRPGQGCSVRLRLEDSIWLGAESSFRTNGRANRNLSCSRPSGRITPTHRQSARCSENSERAPPRATTVVESVRTQTSTTPPPPLDSQSPSPQTHPPADPQIEDRTHPLPYRPPDPVSASSSTACMAKTTGIAEKSPSCSPQSSPGCPRP